VFYKLRLFLSDIRRSHYLCLTVVHGKELQCLGSNIMASIQSFNKTVHRFRVTINAYRHRQNGNMDEYFSSFKSAVIPKKIIKYA
jgi:hypothetical protein